MGISIIMGRSTGKTGNKWPIYGIARGLTGDSSCYWERIRDSEDFDFTASVGTTAGASSFDDGAIYPNIVRETLDSGDVMVKIPRFYVRRHIHGNSEYIEISEHQYNGFEVAPAFRYGSTGQEVPYVHIGAYELGSGYVSKSGVTPLASITRATARSGCKARGTGFYQQGIAEWNTLQMLIMIETGSNDVQSLIGRGNCDGSSYFKTGLADGVANLTGRASGTDGQTSVVWRGIENLWGNYWEWVDGLNLNSLAYWYTLNPNDYADDTFASPYKKLSYSAVSASQSYISRMGLDESDPCVMMFSAVGGSSSTYYADAAWTGGTVLYVSGRSGYGSDDGLFCSALYDSSSYSLSNLSSRLIKKP